MNAYDGVAVLNGNSVTKMIYSDLCDGKYLNCSSACIKQVLGVGWELGGALDHHDDSSDQESGQYGGSELAFPRRSSLSECSAL